MASAATPKSKSLRDCTVAFGVGGAICILGQLMSDMYTMLGFSNDNASLLTSSSLVLLSAIATGLGVYDRLSRHAGAGSLVPITGFANAVVSPAIEFKSEGFIIGTAAKMFVIAGPVIVYGTTASVIAGLIYYFMSM